MSSKIRVGVIGGGQLCRMMGEEVRRLDLPFALYTLDPTPDCPAAPFVEKQIVGDFKDSSKIEKLADLVDIVTFEIETAGADTLAEIERSGKIVAPSANALGIIQNKLRQKEYLLSRGIPVAPFLRVDNIGDLLGERSLDYPFLIKAQEGGYDGRGNTLVKAPQDLDTVIAKFRDTAVYLEKYVDFQAEVSVIAARSRNGEIATYAVGRNIHQNNILHATIVPARMGYPVEEQWVLTPKDKDIAKRAQDVALQVMNAFNTYGVFGIEMFVDKDGEILVNEVAPRVHNTGHWTIEGAQTSQFVQHLYAISEMPLGSCELVGFSQPTYTTVMLNILGPANLNGPYRIVKEGFFPMDVLVHDYGKSESRPERKLGHVTFVGYHLDETRKMMERIRVVPK